jgi:hypothetical protein
MNRKNIDNVRFVDLDEFLILEIVGFKFPNEEEVLKIGYRVDGITKTGARVESLYSDRTSAQDKLCVKFIMENWVNAKK